MKERYGMYRQYENPHTLENELKELIARRKELISTPIDDDNFNWDLLMDMDIRISELEDRINFAWQDDEYDSEYYDFHNEY